MSPGVTEIDESGATGGALGGMIDEQELDAAQPVRQTQHPFGAFCDGIRAELELPNAQNAREVVSAVAKQVGALTVVDEDTLDEQAAHIAKIVAEDRKAQQDPQLWEGPATKVARLVLQKRIEGKAPVSAEAEAAA